MSIRISADGFSLSIYNCADGRRLQSDYTPVAGDSLMHAMLGEALRRPTLAAYRFREMELAADMPCTCVPLEHFSREDMAALYRLAFPAVNASPDEIHYQILPSLEVVEIFPLDPRLAEAVRAVYPDAKVVCHEGCLLERIAADRHGIGARRTSLHAVVDEGSMLVCSFAAKRLRYATTYRVGTDPDRTYFIIAVWKALGMDAAKDTLMLHGASQELAAGLSRFIKKITQCE